MPQPVADVTSIIWPLVMVGRGSSAAYYATAIDVTLYGNVLAIGDDDPWAGKRGHSGNKTDATLKINHPLHLLQHFKNSAPPYAKELVDRSVWAQMNAAALAQCNVQILAAKVKTVLEDDLPQNLGIDGELGPFGYRVDLDDGRHIYAYKVVYCAGTGGHRVPPLLEDAKKADPKRVLDLDEFASLPVSALTPDTHVVVIGSNAAIDAVHKALNYRCHICWLIELQGDQKPAMLETQPKMLAAWKEPAKFKLSIYRYTTYKAGRAGQQVSLAVTLQGGSKTKPETKMVYGNYVAYGVGPDGTTVDVIQKAIQHKLKPIMDGTRALHDANGSASAILGYEADGTGLMRGFEVVGAISASMGRELVKVDSATRKQTLGKQVDVLRKHKHVYFAICTGGYKDQPCLTMDLDALAGMSRASLHKQLQSEVATLTEQNSVVLPNLKFHLERLADLILAYHAAAAFEKLGPNDPARKLEEEYRNKYREGLNKQASNLPKGAVADSGQLTSILSAISALATMRGRLPTYIPKQSFQPAKTKGDAVDVQTTGGGGADNINLQVENAQNIALYVVLVFPHITGGQLNKLMDAFLKDRHESGDGLADERIAKFSREVQAAEAASLLAELQKQAASK